MPIDWLKTEKFPNKMQKIDGQYLLNLRSKINDLEQQVAIKNNNLSKVQSKLTAKDEEIHLLNKQIEDIQENYNELKKEKITILTEVAQLIKEKEQLESRINKSEQDLRKLGVETTNFDGLEVLLSSKDDKIKSLELELINKVRGFESAQKKWNEKYRQQSEEIEQMQKYKNIIYELESKLKETEEYLQLKIQAVNDLNDKIDNLQVAPEILKKIEYLMNLQGFVSEKDYTKMQLEK